MWQKDFVISIIYNLERNLSMVWAKHKTDKADKYFSLWIRNRDKWTCQKCKKYYAPPTSILHCSHFIGRSKENTRFNEINACALCFHCHQFFTSHPIDHYKWQVERLGEQMVDTLDYASHIYCKKDRKAQELYWKQRLLDDFNIKV